MQGILERKIQQDSGIYDILEKKQGKAKDFHSSFQQIFVPHTILSVSGSTLLDPGKMEVNKT